MLIDYQKLLDEAMIEIVKKILIQVQDNGLLDGQCFYISFRTDYPDVILSNHVKNRYPKEITIVLQYQFRDVKVIDDLFSVNLAFSGKNETIQVPFSALTGFVDPAAHFSLQFKKEDDELMRHDLSEENLDLIENLEILPKRNSHNINKANQDDTKQEMGDIIFIDHVRK